MAKMKTSTRRDLAYRTYLIRETIFSGCCWIEKDDFIICHAASVDHAKKLIDGLMDEAAS